MTGRSLALFTDLYELTMLRAYAEHGMAELAVFSLFVRKLPPGRNYLVACGLDDLLGETRVHCPSARKEIAYLSGVGGACRWLTDRFTPSGRMPKRGLANCPNSCEAATRLHALTRWRLAPGSLGTSVAYESSSRRVDLAPKSDCHSPLHSTSDGSVRNLEPNPRAMSSWPCDNGKAVGLRQIDHPLITCQRRHIRPPPLSCLY